MTAALNLSSPPSTGRRHVLCVGAAVLDTLFRVRSIPEKPGKVLPYEMLQVAEGMASSAAYAIVRLGGMASLGPPPAMTPPGIRSSPICSRQA
ncbi:hypothetical protein J2X43_000575 [Rhizobium sp. BE258]|nr:hypothetical protein [Rhizobium sp. BE258]